MNNSHLTKGHCIPCEGSEDPLNREEVAKYLSVLTTKWIVDDDKKIERKFKFKDFKEAVEFVNNVADIAESEGHHPDIGINYNIVKIELTTHAIKGLSMNDFIIAAKIEKSIF